jgi:cytochrome P450
MSRAATIDRFVSGLDGDLAVIADPYPTLHELRKTDPVLRVDGKGVFAFRYDDIEELLPARESLKRGARGGPRHPEGVDDDHAEKSEELRHWAATWLVESDGDRHKRLRGLVRRAFTPRSIERLRGQIEVVVEDLLDEMSGRGELDWADEFAFALPLAVICDLIDVKVEDRESIRDWSRAYGLALRGNGPYELVAPAYEGMMALREYMTRVVAERRESGTESAILQALFDAEAGGEALSSDELVTMMVHLFFGGHDTTANLLASGMYTLLEERTQWERLVADPTLAPQAGEELLRYHPSVMVIERLFPEDWELRGVEIGAEEPIILVLGAANHDPAAYPDPDSLLIGREGPKHLSFGLGPHFCLGAFLNRLEVEVALASVAKRFPDAVLAQDPAEVEWWPSFHLRGIKSVPVNLGSDRK